MFFFFNPILPRTLFCMENFGLASGTSVDGPKFPQFPESVLPGYPSCLVDHPALPSIMASHMSGVGHMTRCIGDLLIENSAVKTVACGICFSTLAYGVYRISLQWTDMASYSETTLGRQAQKASNISSDQGVTTVAKSLSDRGQTDHGARREVKARPQKYADTGAHLCGDSSDHVCLGHGAMLTDTSLHVFHKQLMEALSRLDDTKCRLLDAENVRDMLRAEVTMHKTQIANMQRALNAEKGKCLDAEMKMEMMEVENVQLKKMRKDLTHRTDQVHRLEKCLKEKDQQQERLFSENVVLPRTVAESRAKSFAEMQCRLQTLETQLAVSGFTRYRSLTGSLSSPSKTPGTGPVLALEASPSPKQAVKRRHPKSTLPHSKSPCPRHDGEHQHPSSKLLEEQKETKLTKHLTPVISPPKKVRKLSKVMEEPDGERVEEQADRVERCDNMQLLKSPSNTAVRALKVQDGIMDKLEGLMGGYTVESPLAASSSSRPIFPVGIGDDHSGLVERSATSDDYYPPSSALISASRVFDFNEAALKCSSPVTASSVPNDSGLEVSPSDTSLRRHAVSTPMSDQAVISSMHEETVYKGVDAVAEIVLASPAKKKGSFRKSPCDFQVRFTPKKNEFEFQEDSSEEGSEDSWVVIVPMV